MKTVVWGVLSTAKIGRDRVLPGMKKSSLLEIRAIASRDEARARSTADALGIPKAYGSYEALIADPEIEAIYNPLPNHLHVPLTLEAAAAGKHVLCEKPIALTADEATALRAAAGKVLIAEAFMVRFHPQWLRAQALIREGRIGTLRAVQMFFGYNNLDPANVRNKADIGGGGLYDIGCYAIVAGRFFLAAEPVRAVSLVDRDPTFGTDRLASALVRFRRRPAPRLHGGNTDRAAPAPPVVRHQGQDRDPDSGERAAGCEDASPHRRLLIARRRRDRDRNHAGERPVPAAGRSVLARGARRNRAALRDRGRHRQHARPRRPIPLGEKRAVGGHRPRLSAHQAATAGDFRPPGTQCGRGSTS